MVRREKKSLELYGRRTSMKLELEYWDALQQIADQQNVSVQDLIEQIVEGYTPPDLTSIVRLYVLKYYQQR